MWALGGLTWRSSIDICPWLIHLRHLAGCCCRSGSMSGPAQFDGGSLVGKVPSSSLSRAASVSASISAWSIEPVGPFGVDVFFTTPAALSEGPLPPHSLTFRPTCELTELSLQVLGRFPAHFRAEDEPYGGPNEQK